MLVTLETRGFTPVAHRDFPGCEPAAATADLRLTSQVLGLQSLPPTVVLTQLVALACVSLFAERSIVFIICELSEEQLGVVITALVSVLELLLELGILELLS